MLTIKRISVSDFGFFPKPPDFKEFQELPELVRQALVWGLITQRNGTECGEDEMSQFIIDRYDLNQTLAPGTLILRLSRFLDLDVRIRMVHCYVDHHCNMVAAKLAWHPDYQPS